MTSEKSSSRELKIGLDVDGVLADVIETWISYNNKIRPPISKSDISDWNFWTKLRIGKFDFSKELSSCWLTWEKIPPTESQLPLATSDISKIGTLDIVTAREEATHAYVKNWLRSKKIRYSRYIGVHEGSEKANLDYDVFIDDSPINAKEILDTGKSVIIYNQPWNLRFDDPRVKRIDKLRDAVPIIKSIENHLSESS